MWKHYKKEHNYQEYNKNKFVLLIKEHEVTQRREQCHNSARFKYNLLQVIFKQGHTNPEILVVIEILGLHRQDEAS